MLDTIIAINRARAGLDAPDPILERSFDFKTGANRRLCIYGRMRPGGPDHHLLAPLGGSWTVGQFQGYMQSGVCDIETCPGLVWAPNGEQNTGAVLTSGILPDMWPTLDAHEAPALIRFLINVQTDEGEIIANIFVSADASRAQLMMLDGMNVHDDIGVGR